MQKLCIVIAVGLALAVGMVITGQSTHAGGNQVVIDPGWRYNDGYWNYWDPDDRAWYHTDGRNWYTYDKDAWRVYGFDRGFGRKSFYREGYVAPKAGVNIVVPRHPIYIPK